MHIFLGREFGRVDAPVLSSSGGQYYLKQQVEGLAHFTGLIG